MENLKLKKIPVTESKFPSVQNSEGVNLYPPSFSLNSNQVSEIKDWEVGGKYKLVIVVEQKSKSNNSSATANIIEGSFNILAYKYIPVKKIEDMTDAEFEEYQGKALHMGKLPQ